MYRDFDSNRYGNGSKNGETWREAAGSERWSRKWGESHVDGQVRKYGSSSSGEQWDVVSRKGNQGLRKVQYTWKKVVTDSKQLMKISTPSPPD